MSPTESSTDAPGVKLGLLADPGLPTRLVESVADLLPRTLARATGDRVRCSVHTASSPLTLDENGDLPMVREGREQLRERGWDLIVLVTELPRRAGRRPILADYSLRAGVALVSVPALGMARLRRRFESTVTQVVAEHLLAGLPGNGQENTPQHGGRTLGTAIPVQHITAEDENIDRHLALVGFRGQLRLLAGLVRANRPWRLVPSLSPALAGAAAGAAFGVFYSNIWQLADAFSVGRLMLANVLAILAMIGWLIVDNDLWERPANRRLREEAVLYNAATVATITFGVMCMYALLVAATTAAALVVIPPDYLDSTLKYPTGIAQYLTIAWLSASMGTIAGALGSGLSSERAVRKAAYSERELERRARVESRDDASR